MAPRLGFIIRLVLAKGGHGQARRFERATPPRLASRLNRGLNPRPQRSMACATSPNERPLSVSS